MVGLESLAAMSLRWGSSGESAIDSASTGGRRRSGEVRGQPTDEPDLLESLEATGTDRRDGSGSTLCRICVRDSRIDRLSPSAGRAASHSPAKNGSPPTHIVLEALRLYPIAWLFQRRLRQSDVILCERILPTQTVTISPMRFIASGYWKEPTGFLPERWSASGDRSAYLPFGAGDHGCVGGRLERGLASRLLSEILVRTPRSNRATVGLRSERPLRLPRFILNLLTSSL